MRLIDTRSFQLVDFYSRNVPRYAILSHTWEDEEVSFEEMISPNQKVKEKKGYRKIEKACEKALSRCQYYIWIDTCCIDKKSSAELSECINSMYRYYADAEECYVYLSDLESEPSSSLGHCRWFTRGWTLQELVAPQQVLFYDNLWHFRGTKQELGEQINRITTISMPVLQGEQRLEDISVAMRMSWAANRETTRLEDTAYCLLGIFDVNMPMLYGEGRKAFRRLQEEIIRRSNDMTIFANDSAPILGKRSTTLFADSPLAFAASSLYQSTTHGLLDFSLTNKGLLINASVTLQRFSMLTPSFPAFVEVYGLYVGIAPNSSGEVSNSVDICLRKIGPGLFYRDGRFSLKYYQGSGPVRRQDDYESVMGCYIAAALTQKLINRFCRNRSQSIHAPEDDVWLLVGTMPSPRWDVGDRLFFQAQGTQTSLLAVTLRHKNSSRADLIVLFEDAHLGSTNIYVCTSGHPIHRYIFTGKPYKADWNDGIPLSNFLEDWSGRLVKHCAIVVEVADQRLVVTVSLKDAKLQHEHGCSSVKRLHINTVEL